MHTSFSDRGGEPPTPTKTPTSATFLHTSFDTPKQESSFYDPRVTWNTADPCATSPDFLKSPLYVAFATPTRSPALGESDRKRRFSGPDIEDEIASHVHHLSPNPTLRFPPVESSRQLSSSPSPSLSSSSTKRSGHPASTLASTLPLGPDEDIEPTMRSAGSMQTPPPTSTSASRRKSQHAQAAKLAKQSTASARRMSTPIAPKTKAAEVMSGQTDESPLQLGGLQFSPDGLGFPLSGSATAPIYPQQKLFWDPNQNADGMNLDFSAEDPFTLSFGLGAHKGLDPFVSLGEQTTESPPPPAASFDGFDPRSSHVADVAMSIDLDSAHQAGFLPSSGLMTRGTSSTRFPGKGVNPSLLFGSPGRFPAPTASAPVHHNDTLQPYAHQIGDARMENELGANRKAKKRRKPAEDSPAVTAALQTLRDDNDRHSDASESATDRATVHSRKPRSKNSRVSVRSSEIFKKSARASHGGVHRPGMARPPKRRPVVTLTIDSHGRAKTETKTVCDHDGSSSDARMELDATSDDSETTSSGSTVMIPSRPQSFGLPKHTNRNPKLARFSTDSKTHSQRSSYASTLASGKNANILPVPEDRHPRRVTGHASNIDGPGRPQPTDSINRASSSTTISEDLNWRRDHDRGLDGESEAETVITSDDDRGNAQYELKKIMRNRVHDRAAIRARLNNGQTGEARDHDSHPEQMPSRGHGGSRTANNGRAHTLYDSVSPTTITDPDLATPSTGRESHASETTRCVCHTSENGGELMILW